VPIIHVLLQVPLYDFRGENQFCPGLITGIFHGVSRQPLARIFRGDFGVDFFQEKLIYWTDIPNINADYTIFSGDITFSW